VPTCGVVELRFDVDTWALAGESEPIELDFDYPKKEGRSRNASERIRGVRRVSMR